MVLKVSSFSQLCHCGLVLWLCVCLAMMMVVWVCVCLVMMVVWQVFSVSFVWVSCVSLIVFSLLLGCPNRILQNVECVLATFQPLSVEISFSFSPPLCLGLVSAPRPQRWQRPRHRTNCGKNFAPESRQSQPLTLVPRDLQVGCLRALRLLRLRVECSRALRLRVGCSRALRLRVGCSPASRLQNPIEVRFPVTLELVKKSGCRW